MNRYQLPDGRIIEASPEQMAQLAAAMGGDTNTPDRDNPGIVEGMAQKFNEGLIPFSEKLNAGFDAGTQYAAQGLARLFGADETARGIGGGNPDRSFREFYDRNLDQERTRADAFYKEHPILSSAAEGAGSGLKMAGGLKVAQGLGLLGKGGNALSRLALSMAKSPLHMEAIGGVGEGLANEIIKPETTVGKIITPLIAGNLTKGVFNVGKKGAGALLSGAKNVSDDVMDQNLIKVLGGDNKDKVKTLIRGVQSGNERIADRAKLLNEAFEIQKASPSGYLDPKVKQSITLPETKAASKAYEAFMAKNGGQVVDYTDFINKNPVAVGVLERARMTDPQSFVGIKPNSFAEAQQFKRILNDLTPSDASALPAGTKSALKNASQSLKNIMEKVAPGFRDLDSNFAKAMDTQGVFTKRIIQNARSLANTSNSPFWSGLSSPISAAGLAAGAVEPTVLVGTGAALGGKAAMRAVRRSAAENILNGVKTPGIADLLEPMTLTNAIPKKGNN